RSLTVGYALQAAAMGTTAAAMLARAPAPVVYVFAAVAATSITLTRPAQGALLPWLARAPEELTAVNVTAGLLESGAFFAGPAAAAWPIPSRWPYSCWPFPSLSSVCSPGEPWRWLR